jgi:hypothetical protein
LQEHFICFLAGKKWRIVENGEWRITSVRGKLEMEFPKDLGGSSFRWNDSPWGGIGRFRPSPESDWYHFSIFNAGAFSGTTILTKVRISPILKKCMSFQRKLEPHFAYPIILIKQEGMLLKTLIKVSF